jgi:hypothetical protein
VRILLSNVQGRGIQALDKLFPAHIGNLVSLYGWSSTLRTWYALDNGRFTYREDWSEKEFWKLCCQADRRARYKGHAPQWIAVPDVVGNFSATMNEWSKWAPVLFDVVRWPLALCVQEGATLKKVQKLRPAPDVIFIGGATVEFKLDELAMWCDNFPRIHVGRVNSYGRGLYCWFHGVESVDGTGWCRSKAQRFELVQLLCDMAGKSYPRVRRKLDWYLDNAPLGR